MKRVVVSALALLLAAALGALPAEPAAATGPLVVIPGSVTTLVRADENGAPVVDLMVCATFSQPVAFIEVLVDSTGNGPSTTFDWSGPGKTQSWCGREDGLGPLQPGTVTLDVTISAHNGNGLSEAHGSAIGHYTVPGPPPTAKKTPQQAADLGHASNAMWIAGAVIATGGIVVTVASGGLAAPAVLAFLGSGVAAYMAARLSDLSIDPPDPAYTVVVVPHNPDLAALTSSLVLDPAAAAAFATLRAQWEQEVGLAGAAVAALYKAEGAAAAGDAQWESTQTLAVAGFLKQLSTDLGTEPALRTEVAAALGPAGDPVTEEQVAAAQSSLVVSDLTGQEKSLLTLGMADSTVLGALEPIILSYNAASLAQPTGVLEAFAGADTGSLTDAEAAAAPTVAGWADALTATPTGPVAGGEPSAEPQPTQTAPTSGPVVLPAGSVLPGGGFESISLGEDSFLTLAPADAAKLGPGWVIDAGTVDLVGPQSAQAAEGTQFIDLDGNDGDTPGAIHIDLATKTGHSYLVSFQLAGNPAAEPHKTLVVGFGRTQHTFAFDVGEHSNDALGWTEQHFSGAACAASTRLTMKSTTPGTAGPNIDAIAVTDLGDQGGCGGGGTPWWLFAAIAVLLAGLAVGGLLYLRHRRARPPATVA